MCSPGSHYAGTARPTCCVPSAAPNARPSRSRRCRTPGHHSHSDRRDSKGAPHPRKPSPRAFVGVGAASGLGSALLGSVGPLTAPFFLAYGLVRDAYIRTAAACALTMHLTKLIAYGAGSLLDPQVLLLGVTLTPPLSLEPGPANAP
ncbi:sulfite exporter TauE/SafE family protein [Micromonospora kangleipakensis]|uniref:sulfite exporter TauE/SafE family protein n=1 Tax=Micromonospora kangleipakensis TaxID=1077942 RepID=UPI0030FE0D27